MIGAGQPSAPSSFQRPSSHAPLLTSVECPLSWHVQKNRCVPFVSFPRGEKPGTPIRAKIQEVNQRLAKLDNGRQVHYLDIGPKFLDQEGNIKPAIRYDYLHLTPRGYAIWADAIQPALDELLKKS